MNTEQRKQRDEAIEALTEAYPHLSHEEVVKLQDKLYAIGHRLSLAEIAACNHQAGVDALPAEQERAEQEARKVLAKYNITSEFRLCEDARGFGLMLVLPTGKSNSFIGEVWGWA